MLLKQKLKDIDDSRTSQLESLDGELRYLRGAVSTLISTVEHNDRDMKQSLETERGKARSEASKLKRFFFLL